MLKSLAPVLAVAAITSLLLGACKTEPRASAPGNLSAMVSIEGSTTMLTLLNAWAKAFKAKNPDIPISITTDDSGGGIASLINSTTDLAATSRDLTSDEYDLANSKGVHLKKFTVARDAVAIIVNPTNPVKSISLQQLEAIYTGQLDNWSQIGGKSESIEGLSREKSSGTYRYFQEHVLHGRDTDNSAKLISSTERIVDMVAKDRNAIAYVGMGNAATAGTKIKILPLKLLEHSQPVSPSQTSITRDYPLSRPLLVFTDEHPKPSVEKFVQFCMSDAGQASVPETGYVPIR